jgi:hypothetical protein
VSAGLFACGAGCGHTSCRGKARRLASLHHGRTGDVFLVDLQCGMVSRTRLTIDRYQARLFSRVWLESKNLIQHIPEKLQKYIVLP